MTRRLARLAFLVSTGTGVLPAGYQQGDIYISNGSTPGSAGVCSAAAASALPSGATPGMVQDATGNYIESRQAATADHTAYIFSRYPGPMGYFDHGMEAKVALAGTSSRRYFIGCAVTNNAATASGTDDFADSAIGFQYSTTRGDTNWQFIVNSNGAQTNVDTGVAVTTDEFIFAYEVVGTSRADWYIWDNGGVLLASGTVTAGLPTETTTNFHAVCRTLTAATAYHKMWYMRCYGMPT